eukprot:Protomagalhaensia_sp_Gyna_25__1682@NODE_1878_length_1452_cov_557_767162_g1545_i0_p1_GENE_NODE_1878_length_1452_cov_557_767162_g1545_i0NODE_1878_length_1452_cov_557_767162_g1545_i0_p1_ORF_typecomplete_len379_score78_16Integrin_beta/PF00362_18/1_5e19VWA/PF00092_28/0_0014_NODE_1878_length_1452_cov_557_767162_g1545_i02221358
MRFIRTPFILAVLNAVWAARQDNREIFPDQAARLPRVYGELRPKAVAALQARHASRLRMRKAVEADHAVKRSPTACDFPLDLHILQDATGSFQADFHESATNTLAALRPLYKAHPGSTISLTMFRDKPINQLGEVNDYCIRRQAIRSTNIEQLAAIYNRTVSSGGWDWQENQFAAIVEVLSSPIKFPWMANPAATKMVIMITDSSPHFEGDTPQALYPELRPWETFTENKANQYCRQHYYPSPDQVATAIESAEVYLATIVARPEDYNGQAYAAWEWFNGFIGQTSSFIKPATTGQDGWTQALLDLITSVREAECGEGTGPFPPEIPEVCELPQPRDCDDCLSNAGCCAKTVTVPRITIAHFNPPETLDLELKFRSLS